MPILRLLRTTHKSNLPSYSIQWKSDFLGKASMRARLPVDPEDSRTDRTVMRALSLLRAFRPGFTALTVNVYDVPLVSPVTVPEVVVPTVAVAPPGEAVTW